MAWELTSQHICLIGLVQRRVPQVPEMTEVSPLVQRRQWQPTPVLLPGKSHGRRSLVGCSPWGRWGLDTTERLHFHFSLSCIGKGNGNPLQCSCLENPRDGGAWWAAMYEVTQSRTWLKWLSSSRESQFSQSWKKSALNNDYYKFINKLIFFVGFFPYILENKLFMEENLENEQNLVS